MKTCFCKKTALVVFVLTVLCPWTAYSRNPLRGRRTWEFGLGGTATNLTRTTVTNFRQTAGGDYIFTLDEKLVFGGVQAYSALELKPWLYADLRADIGFARYYDKASVSRQGYSFSAGPGIQFRPFIGSEWVQPYIRLGVSYFHKSFPTCYFGQFSGDVTKEALWKAEDAWNKGYTFDADTFIPVSAGVGILCWMGERVGIRLQGEYFHSFGTDGINFAQAAAGIVLRVGGAGKAKSVADRYISSHPDDYAGLFPQKVVEKVTVREVPVEVVREVIKEIPLEKTLSELMDNVNFDFDKATITADSQFVLDEIAGTISRFPQERFLVAGYTDARGSAKYNESLSRARAKAVYEALVRRGVPADRLCYRGFGKRVAVMSVSASDEARRADRKVVIEKVSSESLWNYLKKQ